MSTPFPIAVVGLVLFAQVPSARAQDRVPTGLSPSDWTCIRAEYEANRHAVAAVESGYQARNRGQRWLTSFDGRGFVTSPNSGDWSWGLELVSYGAGGAERVVEAPACEDAQ